jgi:hypothetical protein
MSSETAQSVAKPRLTTRSWQEGAAAIAERGWTPALALYVAIALLVWLPFNLRTTGLVEEWDFMWLHDRGEQLWWITSGSALSDLRLRPLTALPHAIAYSLGGGFLWFNIGSILVFALKGLAVFLLVDRLAPLRRPAALVAGALAMLYPANTGLFTFRVIHIQIAVVLFLFALVLLSDLVPHVRVLRVVLMAVLLAVSLLMYQIATAALILGPAALLVVGVRKWRRLAGLSALWFAAPATLGVYWLTVATGGGTYEFESTHVEPRPSLGMYWHDLVRAYIDQIVRAWKPSAWVTWKPEYILIGVTCGLVAAAAVLGSGGRSERLGRRSTLIGGLAAIAISPLGFLPLWAISASIHETLKVYLLSSIAVAAGFALLIGYLCRAQVLVAGVGGALVGLAAIYGLHQHAHFAALSRAETRVLGEMTQQLPSPANGTTIIVRDRSGELSKEWTLGPPVTFGAAVEAAYHNPTLAIVLCDEVHHHAYLNGSPLPACPVGRTHESAHLAIFDYELVQELRLIKSPGASLASDYAPLRLAGKGPLGRSSLFVCRPIQNCTKPPSAYWPRGSIHETFGTTVPDITGFRAAENVNGTWYRWSDASETHVFAFLPPRDAHFEMSVLYTVDASVPATIRLAVNGDDVPVRVAPGPKGYQVTAEIPASALEASPDDLEIRSKAVPVAGWPDPLGLAVTRLDVAPQASAG